MNLSPSHRRLVVRLAVGIAVFVVLWLTAPEVITGSTSDLDTFLRVAGLVAALVLWTWLVNRFVTQRTAARLLVIGPLVVVAWMYLWPYFEPSTSVDEAFPVVMASDSSAGVAETPDAPPEATASPEPTLDPTAAPDTGSVTAAAGEASTTPEPTAAVQQPEPTSTTPVPTPTPPAEPVLLRSGQFQGLTGHRGSGTAALYRLADGSALLRFEEVDIGSGPDLNVYVVPGEDRRSLDDATYVAPLTAERGNQNYTLPDGVDLDTGTWTVLVWCESFTVEVANATI